ncbi:MAG: hypothetical protein FJW54_06545 [Actinobacteria bacterium]|nr:hypothetical protein [Actinomycetota bacterium]
MKIKSKIAKATLLSLLISTGTFSIPFVYAVQKLPLLDLSTSFQISDASEIIGFSRNKENWVIAGIDGDEKSWVAQYTEKGEQLWRIFPIIEGGGGAGFITALAVDGEGVVLAGVSQNQLSITRNIQAEPTPSPTETSAPPTAAPSPSLSPSPARTVPLVNPDNVIPETSKPLRENIKNIFLTRIDNSGKLINAFNTENSRDFIPISIATSISTKSTNYFVVGNESSAANESRGGLYLFKSNGSVNPLTFGGKKTSFKRVVVNSASTITVVGSSAETLAGRAVAGKVDGVILTISQSNGALTKVLRSSGKGATRSWDFASGNLLVSGTSRSGSLREGVVTSFSTKGAVSWTTRFPNTIQALANGKCIAVESTTSEVRVYMVDSKGKQSKGARIPSQDLIALGTTLAKGCAILTATPAGEFRVSFR